MKSVVLSCIARVPVFFLTGSIGVIICVLFLYIAFSTRSEIADAQVVNFYSSECTGGWDGVDHAVGEPQVTAPSAEAYTKENSAVLENKAGPITCGRYTGVLPPETYHTRVMVRFSWHQDDLSLPELSEEASSEAMSDMASSSSEPISEHASTDGSLQNGTSTTTEQADEVITSDEAATTTEVQSDTTDVSTSTTDDTVDHTTEIPEVVPTIVEPVSVPESTESVSEPPSEPVEAPLPAAESSPETVSWWPLFRPQFAHAEELSSTSTVEETAAIEATSSPAESEEIVAPESEMSTTTITETIESASAGAQFVVQYTLDGEQWRVLGYVTTIDTDVRLEFPKDVLPSLDDISHIQVSVTPLMQIGTIRPVYLDALWLEVSYAPLGELGVHRISDIIPTITPIDVMVSDDMTAASTSATSSLPHMTIQEFANAIVNIHGIDDRYVLATVITSTSTREIWLFDMSRDLVHRIGRDKAQLGTMQAGVKDGMIFWLNAPQDTIYSYDLRTAGSLHEMTLVSNFPSSTEYVFTFPFTDWEVIWRGNTFYFETEETGEVFQDENTDSARDLFKYFLLTRHLSYERIQEIGGTFITETEADGSYSTSTDSGNTIIDTSEYATSTSEFDSVSSTTITP